MSVPRNRPATRFSLAALIEFTAGVGLFFALVTQLGSVGWLMAGTAATAFLLMSHVLLSGYDPNGLWSEAKSTLLLALALPLFLMFALSLSTLLLRDPRGPHRPSQCAHNLRMLILAFHGYHDDQGHFPPPCLADAKGKPTHSWRVLILPYIEEQGLYQAYDFSEPWNGPNNSKLAGAMPDLFRCPSDDTMPANMANYVYVVDPKRMKRGGKQTFAEFKDESTIVLVESSSARINWLEPRDLTVEEVLSGENTKTSPSPSSFHSQKDRPSGKFFNAAFHDGSVWRIRRDIDRDTLNALLTIDGREEVDLADLGPPDRTPLRALTLLSTTVAFVAVALFRRVRLARRRAPKQR